MIPEMPPEQLAACVDASARALGLPIAPELRPGVERYFALAAQMAALVQAVPLPVALEPAVQFTPVAPRARTGEAS